MTDDHRSGEQDEASPKAALPQGDTPPLLDRRGFFRGVAAVTVGSLAAPMGFAQSSNSSAAISTAPLDANTALDAHASRVLRWTGRDIPVWLRSEGAVDHDVVIVGGGQSGLAIGYALRRKGVGVDIIDRAAPGQAGIWRNIARMNQLRTPKTLSPGPEGGNVALGFRAWFETLNGPEAFDKLDRIPRLAWADYLTWFQQTTGTKVRYRTKLLDIEPAGDMLRLHLEADGQNRVETARKVVFANGYAGGGGPSLPDFVRALPTGVWTHTTGPIAPEKVAGKVVAVIGAGSNAFDAAAVALEAGAAEVHIFNRRAYVDYQGQLPGAAPLASAPPVDRGYSNGLEMGYELPDIVRWRNFLLGERRVASVPLDSLQRAVAFKNLHIHLGTSLADVAVAGNGKIVAKAGSKSMRFDHLIAATGYRIDISEVPELARIHESIALWRDRFEPAKGEENTGGALHPYLGPGFEFLPRAGTAAEFVRNIHCFNLAAALSFGIPVGDIPSMILHPRLVTAIARDLTKADVDIAVNERFINAPLVPPDPAPYRQAVVG